MASIKDTVNGKLVIKFLFCSKKWFVHEKHTPYLQSTTTKIADMFMFLTFPFTKTKDLYQWCILFAVVKREEISYMHENEMESMQLFNTSGYIASHVGFNLSRMPISSPLPSSYYISLSLTMDVLNPNRWPYLDLITYTSQIIQTAQKIQLQAW